MAYINRHLQSLIIRERRHQDRKHGDDQLALLEYLLIARGEIDEAIAALQTGATRHALNESLQAGTVLALLWEKHGYCSRKLEKPRKVKSWKRDQGRMDHVLRNTSRGSTARFSADRNART